MGEKGNITSEELVSSANGMGAVVAGAGTQVTAVFEEAGGQLRDTVIDKSADAGIATATDKWKQHHPSGESDPPASS